MENSRFGHNHAVLFPLMLVVLLPSLCYCYGTSKATHYGSPACKGTLMCKPKSGNKVSNDESTLGACGYGEYGRNVTSGRVASVTKLYRAGLGCGSCYKVWCLEPECTEDGTTVVVTDRSTSGDFDFIFSPQTVESMAKRGMEEELKARTQYNITYLKVPCKFPGYNLMLKVHEDSRYPNYLAMIFYYQAGSRDITSVEIFQEANLVWRECKRAYGAVWVISNPPKSNDLTVRFLAVPSETGNITEAKWVVVPRLIPLAWSPGALYDTNFQLS